MEPILATLNIAFQKLPIPESFLSSMGELGRDIPTELAARIEGKTWPSVRMLDWRMVGATPAVFREYVIPATFAYYLPSLLIGSILDPAFRDWGFEAILPSNRQRKPKGDWWFGYVDAFTNQQRAAIKSFLAHQREASETLDPVDEELITAAEAIWK